jgi:superfamily II DNA or RNA helicase
LVLAPRIALCDQLRIELQSQFFEKLNKKPKLTAIPKRVVNIVQLIEQGSRLRLSNLVIVSTVQMFESMSRSRAAGSRWESSKRRLYQRLLKKTSLVLVDEGHYEPALSWSKALRQILAPRVLFTATPYRNDLKPFDVDPGFSYHFTLEQATADHFIREIKPIDRPVYSDPATFVTDVLDFYDRELRPKWPDARVIIRCDNVTSIGHMAQVMQAKNRSFVAIHDRFKDDGPNPSERRTVPRRDADDHERWYGKNGPTFWIHQFKLLEGIDDSRFRLVAIFEPLGNARQVVQQVGRIIRNPEYPKPSIGYLLDHSGGYHAKEWKTLYDYDSDLANEEGSTEPLMSQFVTEILKAHPRRLYLDGSVKERFAFDNFVPSFDLALPLAANLVRKSRSFEFQKLIKDVERRLEEADHIFRSYVDVAHRTATFIYFAISSAPFLKSTYIWDGAPGVIVVCDLKNLVAFSDSAGATPFGLRGVEKGAKPEHLRKLLSNEEGSRLIDIATKNAQLGHRAVRARALSAASVEETVPALDDYAQVLTRAVGYSSELVWLADHSGKERRNKRRYLGFKHGRVVESSERVGLAEYRTWLTDIEAILEGDRIRLSTFGRYASEVTDKPDPTPRNVLLDVYEVLEAFKTLGNKQLGIEPGQHLEIEDACQDVKRLSGRGAQGDRFIFDVNANGQKRSVDISWDEKRSRYQLQSLELDSMYVSERGFGSLIGYLNREQSFRVLPKTMDAIYVEGEFYELVLPVGEDFDPKTYHVGKLLITVKRLARCKDEKGKKAPPDGSDWSEDSLFGWISRGCRGSDEALKAFGNPDVVVCDDMGTEAADFIISDDSRVVFIHVKGVGAKGKTSKYSAGKLSIVCSQATKNIRYLSMFNTQKPKNVNRWDQEWCSDKTVGCVTNRIRKKPRRCANGEQVWSLLEERIRNPRTNREVWIVLGATLSKSALERALSEPTPRAEAIQAVTLLHGTLSTIGSIDAKLRVFCSP